ncbi:MAG: hypothetical protein N2Z60_04230 [Elusimicrobiales bacterium]|nr:hypothetical protein [Elusimicrobiales bacterium]HOJ86139.1 hypothetical protein [Elusimicrobiales bacterium]HOL62566.1 hypothetical protein [Elusimicrobiales bacterium]HPO94484.1 hypothetical protein [Elusimicrobiales bacterium]
MRIRLMTYGINSVIIQTLVLREIISDFQSNELFVSLTILGWLIFGAQGVRFSEKLVTEKHYEKTIKAYHIITPLVLALSLLFIKKIKISLSPLGESLDFGSSMLVSFFSSFFYGFINGIYYSVSSKMKGSDYVKTYYWEALGYGLGGFILYFSFNFPQDLLILFLFIVAINVFQIYRTKTAFLFFLSINIFAMIKADKIYRSYQTSNRNIIQTLNSPYSKIEVLEMGEEVVIYSNSSRISTTMKDFSVGKNVFIPIYHNPEPRKIAVFDKNIALIKEIRLYNPKELYIMEKDKKLSDLISKYLENSGLNVKFAKESPASFFKKTKNLDIIFLPPVLTQNGYGEYYYSRSFLKLIKKSLSENGIVAVKIPFPSYSNYPINKKISELIKYNIKSEFRYAYEYEGDETVIIAGEKKPIFEKKDLKHIKKEYLEYFKETAKEIEINPKKSFLITNPSLSLYSSLNEIAKYKPKMALIIASKPDMIFSVIFLSVIVFFIIIFLKSKTKAIMSFSSFLFTFSEILAIFIINNRYSSLYSEIQWIITSAMAGLSSGAAYKINPPIKLPNILIVSCLSLLFFPNKYVLYTSIFAIGFVNGKIFRELTQKESNKKYEIYIYDIYGGAVGIAVSSFLIGLGGITISIISLTTLGLLFLLYIRFYPKIVD